jgi:hypothetical protein
MTNSVRFYRDVLGMEIIYGGEDDCFSSLSTKDFKKLSDFRVKSEENYAAIGKTKPPKFRRIKRPSC